MQNGTIVKIANRWYIRYWEKRNINGTLTDKRVSHCLGKVTTRGKHPPVDVEKEGAAYMATVNGSKIPAERIVTVGDFVSRVYLPWIEQYKRPSTAKGYRHIWEDHLQPHAEKAWLRDVRTHHVQRWLDAVGKDGQLSRNTLRHIKSAISGIFTLAKRQDYFPGENPARDTGINPLAAEAEETHAYSLEEIQVILALLPEPAATAFAVAAYMGLRHGEIQGLLWENYRDGEMHITRSIWNGRVGEPKTRKGRAPVPVIRQLAERLETHRLRSGNPEAGPIFRNSAGKPLALTSVVNRVVLPVLRKAGVEWHGWHAARRGLGSNLYRLGVPDMVIQRILRHANVSTTTGYYIKTAADDVRNAMTMLENSISQPELDTNWTLKSHSSTTPSTVQ